jgi:hypothetical protein
MFCLQSINCACVVLPLFMPYGTVWLSAWSCAGLVSAYQFLGGQKLKEAEDAVVTFLYAL